MNAQDVLTNGVGGAVAAYIGSVIISFCRAPKLLDDERQVTMDLKDSQLLEQKDLVANLQDALGKKYPRDEYREKILVDLLSTLPPEDLRFLQWLLQAGRSNRQAIGQAGFGGMEEGVLHFTKDSGLVKKQVVNTANGIGEIDREYWINPNFELALSNFFHTTS
jgi:hypothetical protein